MIFSCFPFNAEIKNASFRNFKWLIRREKYILIDDRCFLTFLLIFFSITLNHQTHRVFFPINILSSFIYISHSYGFFFSNYMKNLIRTLTNNIRNLFINFIKDSNVNRTYVLRIKFRYIFSYKD
jgi:hypothetical protein